MPRSARLYVVLLAALSSAARTASAGEQARSAARTGRVHEPKSSPTPPAPAANRTPTPIDGLGHNLLDAVSGTRWLYYAAAVAVTGGMAYSGGDHAVRVEVQRHLVAPAWADSAYYAGYIAPAVVAPGLYLVGLATGDRNLAGAGAAALQALAVTLGATGLLKVATGRVFPLNGGDPRAPDRLNHPEYAHLFYPFQPARGWAWPSGHTSASVSIAAALSAYYAGNPWVPIVAYPLALGIGFGTVDGDRHWTSDMIAGALIGQAIGWSVGSGFRVATGSSRASASLIVPRSLPGGGLELDWVGVF